MHRNNSHGKIEQQHNQLSNTGYEAINSQKTPKKKDGEEEECYLVDSWNDIQSYQCIDI